MSGNIRLGIIGCGRAAEYIYLPVLKKAEGVIVTAAVDPLKERREFIQGRIKNCLAAERLSDKMFDLIDAAVISTPPDTHIPIAIELLKNNKHVLIEKPLSLNMERITDLQNTASRSKAHLLMAFNHRYWAPVIKFRNFLMQNDIGNSYLSGEIIFSGDYTGWNPISFRSDSLEDLGPHVFDLIRYLFNQEIYSVSALSLKGQRYEFHIKVDNGNDIFVIISHSDKTQKTIKVRVNNKTYFISLGSARFSPFSGIKRRALDLTDTMIRKMLLRTSPIKSSYELQFERFIALIKTAASFKPDITDGIAAVKAVSAARMSLIRKEEVILDEIK